MYAFNTISHQTVDLGLVMFSCDWGQDLRFYNKSGLQIYIHILFFSLPDRKNRSRKLPVGWRKSQPDACEHSCRNHSQIWRRLHTCVHTLSQISDGDFSLVFLQVVKYFTLFLHIFLSLISGQKSNKLNLSKENGKAETWILNIEYCMPRWMLRILLVASPMTPTLP